ncbi:MAG TPA: c-type cytochrome [Candidatus Elarobacter sp.]|nr:c-type cytochrome [Candidatus Elarobacter sp.]
MNLPSPSWAVVTAAAAVAVIVGCTATANTSTTPATASGAVAMAPNSPHVAATTPEAAGEYLTIAGGCNDCHTARWGETNGNVAPADRLTGNAVGYRGPWGTSYAANLRLVTQRISEDQWVHILTTADDGKGDPPMPWMNFRMMHDQDIRALYRYIKSLGPKGERTPRSVPPGQTPTGPYVDFSVRQPGM